MPEPDLVIRPPTRTQRDSVRASHTEAAIDRADETRWEVEELEGAPVRPSSRRDWRLHLAVVMTFAVVGAGVIGGMADHATSPAAADAVVLPSPQSSDPGLAEVGAHPVTVRFDEPASDARIDGAWIPVRAGISPAGAPILLAAIIGGAVIGLGGVNDTRGGEIRAGLPVFAPPVQVTVELLALQGGASAATAATLRSQALARTTLTLAPEGPVGWWPSDVRHGDGRITIAIAGCAPLDLDRLQVRLVSGSGDVLDEATVAIVRNEAIPGAIGGHALGLGSFSGTLTTTADVRVMRVEADWTDPAGSSWGTSVQLIDLADPKVRRDR